MTDELSTVVAFEDAVDGIPLREAREIWDAIAEATGNLPAISADPKQTKLPRNGSASLTPVYDAISAGFKPATAGALGLYAIAKITEVVLTFLGASSSRKIHIRLPDQTEVTVEGPGATAETVNKILGPPGDKATPTE